MVLSSLCDLRTENVLVRSRDTAFVLMFQSKLVRILQRNAWRTDELLLKIKGNQKYLFAMMDDETRYWIAQEVANTKQDHDARGLFREGKKIAGKVPARLITDGLGSYANAYRDEFASAPFPKTEHIREIALDGVVHKARAILSLENGVKRVSENEYLVRSQSSNGEYRVEKSFSSWICTCPDFVYRGWTCKHIFAAQFSQNIREEVKQHLVINPISVSVCLFCKSEKLKKAGLRHNKSGDIQKYECLICHRQFSINIGFEKMKHNPKAVTSAMQLYFSGESLRNTQNSLRLLGVDVSYQTVWNWIQKYCSFVAGRRYCESAR